ncbi:S-layer homology domain-containing protein [Arthrobacter gengyunqii]|uniref:S-layer homology domain-containing protein n=1 Tax=Arthrobacter gengyunqii TaxID=2886940 RepID=A0A9X1M3T6_9MICC|nr:S-layer homology domain-containing protein [Arthrobacter gengyunqii]MCC3270082.1 S-layer homology domain-containing protein [Arthrobacter gengyunqii]UOY95004.1 S-layer homology domain-containing protein [Arthrobacter gengyunqii]
MSGVADITLPRGADGQLPKGKHLLFRAEKQTTGAGLLMVFSAANAMELKPGKHLVHEPNSDGPLDQGVLQPGQGPHSPRSDDLHHHRLVVTLLHIASDNEVGAGPLPASWRYYSWRYYSVWQYSSTGPFVGDSNVWNGTAEAQTTGISTGWSDGTFRPYKPIKRDAMAAFLHRFDSKFQAAPAGIRRMAV